MPKNKVEIFQETLQILDNRIYDINGKNVSLTLTPDMMRAATVLLPPVVAGIRDSVSAKKLRRPGTGNIFCENIDL